MSARIAAAVRKEPRLGVGLAIVLAALIAVVVVLVSGLSTAAGAAPKAARAHRAVGRTAALGPAQINANVNGLISQMTVQQKFGQLEMAGPSSPTGSDLIPLAQSGQIGTVLDLTGV